MKVFNLYWSSLNVCCYSYFGKGSKSLIHPITYIALTNTPTHTIQSTPLGPTLGSVATASECTVEELGIKSTPHPPNQCTTRYSLLGHSHPQKAKSKSTFPWTPLLDSIGIINLRLINNTVKPQP